MRRGVAVGPDALTRPTQPVPRDPFGTRLRPLGPLGAQAGAPGVLEPLAEDPALGLLEGSDGVLGGFTQGEEGRPPDRPGTRLLAALGRPPAAPEEVEGDEPAPEPEPLPVVAATRIGKGLVIRVGLPEWSQRVVADPEVEQINRNLVDLLRGVRPRLRSSRR
jgi:hypothetical protein